MLNCRRDVDIGGGLGILKAASKIGTGSDESRMHIEGAERGMRSLAGSAIPIRVNHARDTELILFCAPAERHYNVRRIRRVDVNRAERKRAWQRIATEKRAGEVTCLQPFDHA